MGFTTRDTILLIPVVNVIGMARCCSVIRDRAGHIRIDYSGRLDCYRIAGPSATDAAMFWLAANCVGLCLDLPVRGPGTGRFSVRRDDRPSFSGCGGWRSNVRPFSVRVMAVSGLSGGDHRLAILLTGTYFVAPAAAGRADARRGRQAALQDVQTERLNINGVCGCQAGAVMKSSDRGMQCLVF
jgi:UMF1 family MFS transporter